MLSAKPVKINKTLISIVPAHAHSPTLVHEKAAILILESKQ